MLFSDDQIAAFINDQFEPAWENVRDVPLVTIDFGGGNVIRRTVNGNIATHVCNAQGQVLDILPGIYQPETFLRNLEQLAALHRWSQQFESPETAIRDYHRLQARVLAAGGPPLELVVEPSRTKAIIERAVKLVLRSPAPQSSPGANRSPGESRDATDVAHWPEMAEDTRINESQRRRRIHEYLAEHESATPADLKVWLYRNVLDADLEDPYLGLGKTLFASYPFPSDH